MALPTDDNSLLGDIELKSEYEFSEMQSSELPLEHDSLIESRNTCLFESAIYRDQLAKPHPKTRAFLQWFLTVLVGGTPIFVAFLSQITLPDRNLC